MLHLKHFLERYLCFMDSLIVKDAQKPPLVLSKLKPLHIGNSHPLGAEEALSLLE